MNITWKKIVIEILKLAITLLGSAGGAYTAVSFIG